MPPDPPGKNWLRRTIITVRLLRNVFELLQKLWTTLCLFLQNIVSHVGVFPALKSHVGHANHGNLKIYRGVGVSSTFLAVMRCSYYFFCGVAVSRNPQCPPTHCTSTVWICASFVLVHTVLVQFGSVQVLFLFTLYWYSLDLCKFCSCSHCAGTVWICASFVPVHTVLVQFGSVQVLFLFTLYQYSLDLCKFCSRSHCTGTVWICVSFVPVHTVLVQFLPNLHSAHSCEDFLFNRFPNKKPFLRRVLVHGLVSVTRKFKKKKRKAHKKNT